MLIRQNQQIACLISKLRRDSGLTQVEFARKCGVSFRTIQRIEGGEISPRMELVIRILNCLEISPTSFFIDSFFHSKSPANAPTVKNVIPSIDSPKHQLKDKPILIEMFEVEAIKRSLNNDFQNGISHIGYWEWNLNTSEFFWSCQMYSIYEVDPLEPFSPDWTKQILPEDFKRVQTDIENLINHNIPYDNTHEVYSKETGEKFKVKATAKKCVNPNGEVVIFGIAERV